MPKLLIISQVYPPDPAAVGQQFGDVAEEMVRRGWQVQVWTAARGYEDPSVRYPRQELRSGVRVSRLPWSSFGKGSIQGIFPLEVGGVGLRLTTAKFFSPKGKAYSRVGVEPDLVVRSTARQPGDESTAAGLPASAVAGPVVPPAADPALEAAIAAARRSIERQSSLPTGRAQPSGRARASR